MIPPVAAVLIVMGSAVATSSQDPIPVVRARYHRVTFENDDVRVIHIEIPEAAATDYHEHTLDSVAVGTHASIRLVATTRRRGCGGDVHGWGCDLHAGANAVHPPGWQHRR